MTTKREAMTVTESNTVIDDDGRVIAGPFPTNAAAWRWVDLNTDDGLDGEEWLGRRYARRGDR